MRNWFTPLDASIVAGSYNENVTKRSFVSHFLDPSSHSGSVPGCATSAAVADPAAVGMSIPSKYQEVQLVWCT